jgi:hypothetical protein
MQGFWDTFQKIAKTVGTGVDIGRNLGLFQASPSSPSATVSEVELQNFWSVFKKIGDIAGGVGKVASSVGGVIGGIQDVGKNLGVLQAGVPQQSDLTPESAMAILQQVAPVLQTVIQQQQPPAVFH